MSKTKRLIIFIAAFVIIAGVMTLSFSRRLEVSVGITAEKQDPDSFFSGGIAKYPGAGTYAWVIFILGLIAVGTMAFLVLRSGWRMEKLFLAIVIPLGLLYMFMMAPLSIPDEQVHYQCAYQISGVLTFQPGKAIAEHLDYHGLVGHYNLSSGYDRMMQDVFAPLGRGEEISLPYCYNMAYPVMYLPQALGIALGRLIWGNMVQILLIGRLFNLLFYTLCVYWAIRLTPKYKPLFLMVGLVPMAMQQAASLSYDAFNIGGALLLFGAVFRTAAGKEKITIREFGLIALIGLLLIPAKPTNFPLLLFYLLIPSERFRNWKQRWIWLGGAWLLTLGVVLLTQRSGISGVATSYDNALNWEGKQNYSVAYALSHPVDTIKVYVNTIRIDGSLLFYQSIGSVLAGQTMPLPMSYIKIYLILMILCVLRRAGSSDRITWQSRTIFLGSSLLCVFLTMTTMFLIWTSEGRETIQGLQGRYFTPCLLPALLCLDNDVIILHRDVDKFVIITGLVMHMGIIMEVLCKTMLN